MKALSTIVCISALTFGGHSLWSLKKSSTPAAKASLPSLMENKVAAPAEKLAPTAETKPVAVEVPAATVEFEATELLTAVQQGIVQAQLRGNGRDKINAQLRNNSPTPLRVHAPAGQMFESGRNSVVLLRPVEVELMPAQSLEIGLATAALSSANRVTDSSYKLSYQTPGKATNFVSWLSDHPEIATASAQTAILILNENLPLAALAKFAPANGSAAPQTGEGFRAETSDLIGALTALRLAGISMEGVAIAVDPQLRIEAMIEPLSRELAKRFYGISEEREWDYWKGELLAGDPSTRHYALFGIARFYPDVAIEMLPKWVRETKTHPVYRMAAVQALADTQRPEALSLLHRLADELGTGSELGKAAIQSANYLDQRLNMLATASVTTFRGKKGVVGF